MGLWIPERGFDPRSPDANVAERQTHQLEGLAGSTVEVRILSFARHEVKRRAGGGMADAPRSDRGG
jgi:hypothetical protein